MRPNNRVVTMANQTYSSSGVDVEKVKGMHSALWAKIGPTFEINRGKIGHPVKLFGHYGGIFRGSGRELYVIHTDGVGSKVLLAQQLGKFNTVGIDAIAMSANDILCMGAKPLVAVDYLALAKEDAELTDKLMDGLVAGAQEAGCAIVGGETAILPDIIKGEGRPFDLAVTMVGFVDEGKLVIGAKMKEGDVIVGLESSGLHSNGYTLARRALDSKKWGAEMLIPTKIYVKCVLEMLAAADVHGLAHITGGAFSKLTRIGEHSNVGFMLDNMPSPAPIFEALAKSVGSDYEMYRTFNMGVGMCVVCGKKDANAIIGIAKKHGIGATIIGSVTKETGVVLQKAGKKTKLA